MHRAFSSVSAVIGVALEANVRNLPTLLNRENGQCCPAGHSTQSDSSIELPPLSLFEG